MSVGTGRNRSVRIGFAATAVLAVLSTGCDGEAKPTEMPPSSSTTTAPTGTNSPASFDPCTALTPQFLGERQWDALPPSPKQNTTAGISWQGCRYVAKAGYGFSVQTSTGTLDQVRQKFPVAVEVPIGARRALRYEARPDVPGGCTINVEMKTGSLYILVDDPTGKHPRKLSPCDNATEIAQAVAPLLPAGS